MSRACLIYIIAFLTITSVTAQEVEVVHSIHLSVGFPKKFRINLSYNAHFRSHIKMVDELALTPIADVKLSLFSNHLGSSILQKFNSPFYTNFTFSYGGLVSYEEGRPGIERYVPVFTTHYANTFNNAYLYNFGFATSQVFQIGLKKKPSTKRNVLRQQVGNLMVSVHDVYLTYYNDGGPVLKFFGDAEDRYWTGGLAIGAIIRKDGNIHQAEVSFDKFTGFAQNAFEATGLLFIDNVLYKDIEQFSYNTGRLGVRYFNHNMEIGVSANVWNIPFDLQDYLHRDVSNNPYHHKIENEYLDIEFFKFRRL